MYAYLLNYSMESFSKLTRNLSSLRLWLEFNRYFGYGVHVTETRCDKSLKVCNNFNTGEININISKCIIIYNVPLR